MISYFRKIEVYYNVSLQRIIYLQNIAPIIFFNSLKYGLDDYCYIDSGHNDAFAM